MIETNTFYVHHSSALSGGLCTNSQLVFLVFTSKLVAVVYSEISENSEKNENWSSQTSINSERCYIPLNFGLKLNEIIIPKVVAGIF